MQARGMTWKTFLVPHDFLEKLARTPLVYGVWFDGVAGTPGPEAFEVDPGVPFRAAPVARRPGKFEILRLTPPPPGSPRNPRAGRR